MPCGMAFVDLYNRVLDHWYVQDACFHPFTIPAWVHEVDFAQVAAYIILPNTSYYNNQC